LFITIGILRQQSDQRWGLRAILLVESASCTCVAAGFGQQRTPLIEVQAEILEQSIHAQQRQSPAAFAAIVSVQVVQQSHHRFAVVLEKLLTQLHARRSAITLQLPFIGV
jgi:hypothetical protein